MLIDATFFFGDIQIAQLSEVSVNENVTRHINQYESELLSSLLGYETYELVKAGLNTNPATPIYKALRDGGVYTYNNEQRRFKGLVQTNPSRSLIAYYVYYYYTRNNMTSTTGVGEVKSKGANSVSVNPYRKMVNAWNSMVELNKDLFRYLEANEADFPEWREYVNSNRCEFSQLLTPINSFNI